MADIKNYLAITYLTKEERKNVEELNLANQNLTGELDLTGLGFDNLKRLNLLNNRLTKLILLYPTQLTFLDVSNNQLTELNVDSLYNLTFGQINKNPLPDETKKKFLIQRWNYYKDVEKHYSDLVSPEIMKLVDISDLDNFIDNYDFDKEGDAPYHNLVGSYFTYLDEHSLQQLGQQVLARALIKQNELMGSKDENYEIAINNYARTFQKANSMYIQYDLSLIQREVLRKIAGEEDPAATFQKKLFELEETFKPIRESINAGEKPSLPSVENIKEKITELQDITQQQKTEISQLWQSLKNKETQRRTLEENHRLSEAEKKQVNINLTNSQQANEKLSEKLSTFATYEQNYQAKIKELEKEINSLVSKNDTDSALLKNEFTKLLQERENYILKLEKTIQKLKNEIAETETQTPPSPTNYWQRGLIGVAILVGIGLIWWGLKKYFF